MGWDTWERKIIGCMPLPCSRGGSICLPFLLCAACLRSSAPMHGMLHARELPVKASAKGDHGRVLFLESEGTNFKERARMHEICAKNQSIKEIAHTRQILMMYWKSRSDAVCSSRILPFWSLNRELKIRFKLKYSPKCRIVICQTSPLIHVPTWDFVIFIILYGA